MKYIAVAAVVAAADDDDNDDDDDDNDDCGGGDCQYIDGGHELSSAGRLHQQVDARARGTRGDLPGAGNAGECLGQAAD